MPITEFVNIDLELHADGGLEQFLNYVRPSVDVLHQTPKFLAIELAGVFSDEPPSVDRTIRAFASLISTLPPEAMSIWKRLDRRIFDIGIQAGCNPRSTGFTVSNSAITLLHDLDAEVVFTVYAPPEAKPAAQAASEGGT
ncbi:MAG: hypothetical protein JO001_27120 [Alphaproteobacteria bacterium]|nr:hypothetical protein [Alphaproteobacteria bacterium]